MVLVFRQYFIEVNRMGFPSKANSFFGPFSFFVEQEMRCHRLLRHFENGIRFSNVFPAFRVLSVFSLMEREVSIE